VQCRGDFRACEIDCVLDRIWKVGAVSPKPPLPDLCACDFSDMLLVISRDDFEISLRVLAYGAFQQGFGPFMDKTAVPAAPLDLLGLLKH